MSSQRLFHALAPSVDPNGMYKTLLFFFSFVVFFLKNNNLFYNLYLHSLIGKKNSLNKQLET